jgi:hypothetical protein
VTPGRAQAQGSEALPVQVQIRFERFPASIKGAFVLRGGDGDPHAVQFDWARVARIPAGPAKPVTLEDRMLDVAPIRDLFVPFEVAVVEIEPSWYVIESSLRVDGGRSYTYSGRPFTIPWPRSDVRRGTLPVSKKVRVADVEFHVDRVELGWDSAAVLWRAPGGVDEAESKDAPGRGAEAILRADRVELEPLPDQVGSRLTEPRSPGERRTLTYPVMRSASSLDLQMQLRSGEASDPLPLKLP